MSSQQRSIPNVDRISDLPATFSLFSQPKHLSPQASESIMALRSLSDYNGQPCFQQFVNSVMLRRDPTLPIRSFRIKCTGCHYNRFVPVAVQRGLESFVVDLNLFSIVETLLFLS